MIIRGKLKYEGSGAKEWLSQRSCGISIFEVFRTWLDIATADSSTVVKWEARLDKLKIAYLTNVSIVLCLLLGSKIKRMLIGGADSGTQFLMQPPEYYCSYFC